MFTMKNVLINGSKDLTNVLYVEKVNLILVSKIMKEITGKGLKKRMN